MTATTVKPLTILQQLRDLRCDQRIHQQHIAATIGVSATSISHWEHGTTSPNIHHAIAYAHAIGRRLTITRHHQEVADLADTLPKLADLRRRHHLPRRMVAERLHVATGAIAALERQTKAGGGVRLPTVERYLTALGYRVGIATSKVVSVPC